MKNEATVCDRWLGLDRCVADVADYELVGKPMWARLPFHHFRRFREKSKANFGEAFRCAGSNANRVCRNA